MARTQWKNSKCFLNLEKRNHVKKHVRKLRISDVISTDRFMIMDSQRPFYMNLYRSRNVNLDNAESSIFFDSPNSPSISWVEKVLKTFSSAKTPGNDGIPIEFYNTYWPLLSDILIQLIPVMKLLWRRKCPHLKDKQWLLLRNRIKFYYSFKIFSRFWLVKTTHIIHHNQLLFTKFGKNLRHIESMTSKVQPAENYWTRCRLLNRWPRKPGDKVVLYLVSGKTKSVMAKLL